MSRRRPLLRVLSVLLCAASPAIGAQGSYDPAPGFISPGVRIAGIDVGGLTKGQARLKVVREHIRPRQARLALSYRGRRISIDPKAAGYRATPERALTAAMAIGRSKPLAPVDIPVKERVDAAMLAALIDRRARALAVSGVDARVRLVGRRPRVTKFRWGHEVDRTAAAARLTQALIRRRLAVYPLPSRRVAPAVTAIGPVVVVERDRFALTLYRGKRRVREFRIAVGQSAYPTPAGAFRIIQKQRNPTWFPPDSPWARGLGPKPPGPGNPLGTRWMGTSAPAIGIHGTPAPWSLGTRASHGCIRMRVSEAEYLYDRIEIGTRVYIV